MRYSDIPGYKESIMAIAEGRFDEAKMHILKSLIFGREVGARTLLVASAQRMGVVLCRQGDSWGARVLYELSEELDIGSLGAKLTHAEFLLSDLGDAAAATHKCKEIIERAKSNPNPESEADYGSEQYIEFANDILSRAAAANGSG